MDQFSLPNWFGVTGIEHTWGVYASAQSILVADALFPEELFQLDERRLFKFVLEDFEPGKSC
jgi:hypothetical protein